MLYTTEIILKILQKVSRDSYVVQVCSYKFQEFHQDVKSKVLQIEM